MCNECNFRLIYQFESEEVWKKFDIEFIKHMSNGLTIIEAEHHDSTCYTCNSCGKIWAYSYPENAWRGYFLPLDIAVEHLKEIERKDRVRRIVGLVLLVLGIVAIVKSCTGST